MGAVLQTAGVAELAAELTCCACSSICGLAARDSATRAKFRYCSFLMLATVTCVISLIPGLRGKLDKIPNLCTKVVSPDTCDKLVGFGAVYRIIFAMTVFHFILAILTVRVTRVKSFRARFNNGLWMFKLGLIFGLTFATFYFPIRTALFRVWMYLSLTGGFLFVMFQIILVIDFGHSWSLTWTEKLETGHTKLWYVAMAVVTLLMFAVSFGAVIAFYMYFTHPANILKCNANFFYISFMGVQCILAVAISVTPTVQNDLPGAGLIQSSIVVMYALYLTWNTLSSEPDTSCNPLGNVILEYDSFTGVSGGEIFGCLLTLVLLLFACTVRTSTSHLGKYGLALAESEMYAMATFYEDQKKDGGKEVRIEEDGTNDEGVSLADYAGYNYSFFHIIMSFASLHILMVLTNWHSPEENSSMKTLVKNWPSVWVQMASSFACVLMYIWFLVTPLVKRIWGPTFGVNFNETVIYEKSIRANLFSFNKLKRKTAPTSPSPIQPIIAQQPITRDQNNETRQSAVHDSQRKLHLSRNIVVQPIDVTKQEDTVQARDTASSLDSSFKQAPNKDTCQYDNAKKNAFENASRLFTKKSDQLSRVSTSTKRNNFYDYSSRRKKRNLRHSGYEANSNTSIESINSWVSASYREKYQPLRYYDPYDSDNIIPEEEQASPIEENVWRGGVKALRKQGSIYSKTQNAENSRNTEQQHDSNSTATTTNFTSKITRQQPQSSLTIKIRKSSHPSQISRIYDEEVDNDISDDTSHRKRRRRKVFKRLRTKRRESSRNISHNSILTLAAHPRNVPLITNLSPLNNNKISLGVHQQSCSLQNNQRDVSCNISAKNSLTREDLSESRREGTSNETNPIAEREFRANPLSSPKHHSDKMTQMTHQDISLVPSIFKHKPQNTETASELLKLQWKILRTQAKIVKIQERIFKIQDSGEEKKETLRTKKCPGSSKSDCNDNDKRPVTNKARVKKRL